MMPRRRQIPANVSIPNDSDKVAFTCYTNQVGACSYTLPDGSPTPMEPGSRVLLDIGTNARLLESVPAPYDEAQQYYDSAAQFTSDAVALLGCLSPYLDPDQDNIPYPPHLCPADAGSEAAQGCPDADNDGVIDSVDLCVDVAGPAETWLSAADRRAAARS